MEQPGFVLEYAPGQEYRFRSAALRNACTAALRHCRVEDIPTPWREAERVTLAQFKVLGRPTTAPFSSGAGEPVASGQSDPDFGLPREVAVRPLTTPTPPPRPAVAPPRHRHPQTSTAPVPAGPDSASVPELGAADSRPPAGEGKSFHQWRVEYEAWRAARAAASAHPFPTRPGPAADSSAPSAAAPTPHANVPGEAAFHPTNQTEAAVHVARRYGLDYWPALQRAQTLFPQLWGRKGPHHPETRDEAIRARAIELQRVRGGPFTDRLREAEAELSSPGTAPGGTPAAPVGPGAA